MKSIVVFVLAVTCAIVGEVHAQQRMIGGKDTNIKDYPFMAHFTYFGDPVGNGAVLSDTWVLSAAIVVLGTPTSAYLVLLGSSDYRNGPQKFQVERKFLHPEYVGYDYNLGLAKLARRIKFSNVVRPIQIATDSPDYIRLTMLSFGQNDLGTSHLQKAEFDMSVDPNCISKLKEYEAKLVVQVGHGYCVTSPGGRGGHYFTDIGAPVVSSSNKLYAMFSFSEGPGGVTVVSVATRLLPHKEWIDKTMARFP
ncbi:trypsin-7-like [Anopheles bellator]|uniref:trypsin-7-like n=1 Tax=Anopheles bellator TaxID=139047 RepID=UPI00264747A4|nr:trypsin-7-like [Anopheles bellator]